ncbi:ribonuclease Z [Brotaphodocola sp.]|uniref:ribonuclease Z n=1 Tax=Brotaphodocola sp. TaxID=3073577 RepID=UPI003D7E253F
MLDICLLGTGGMMPLPYRWLTAMMARCDGSSLLIDCGEGTQVALKEKGWSPKPIDVICFTHYHADHISGLPGLLLTMGNAERTEPLTLIGPKGLERVVGALRVIAPELPFPLQFIELEEQRQQLKIGPYTIDAYRVNHNVICYGYSISIPRTGKFDLERAKAQGVPMKAWSRLQKGETLEIDGVTYTPDMVLGPDRRGLKVTYCTDTRPVPVIAEYAQDADLFICEGMYGEDGKEAKAREHRHMTMYEAADLARRAQPREMWLTHYSPSLTRPDEFMDKVKKIFPRAKAARDGWTRELMFEEESGEKQES